jgi:predicted amidohydrolase
LRFPEVARFAVTRGCQLLINPAAWVDGRLKAEQWRTLLSARAIENEIFVAGLSRVDKGYIGQSAMFGPDGVMLASGGVREELVTARIDLSTIDEVRAAMPVLAHRRPELY